MNAFPDIDAFRRQLFSKIRRVLAEARHQAAVLLQQSERGQRTHDDGRRKRIREKIGPRLLSEIVDEHLWTGCEATMRAAERLAQSRGVGIDLPEDAQLFGRPAPALAEDSGPVRIVDDEERAVFPGDADHL